MGEFEIVIQARLGSSRFPKKITSHIHGSSLLKGIYNQATRVPGANVTICAPKDERTDVFWSEFNRDAIVFGSHENLLSRYWQVAQTTTNKIFVRLTGDNPCVSRDVILNTVEYLIDNNLDYVSSKRDDGAYIPFGLGCEVFTKEALARVRLSKDPICQEHVSEAFLLDSRIRSSVLYKPLVFCDKHTKDFSLTLDHKSQLELFKKVGRLLCD